MRSSPTLIWPKLDAWTGKLDDGISVDAAADLITFRRTRHVALVAFAVFSVRVSARTDRVGRRTVTDHLQSSVLVILHTIGGATRKFVGRPTPNMRPTGHDRRSTAFLSNVAFLHILCFAR